MASLPDKVQVTRMVMGGRRETMVCPEAPAKTIERVEVAVAVMATAVAAAEVIAVIRISYPFTPAAAKAPKKVGDVPTKSGIKRKSSSAPPSQMGEGSEPGKMPFTKT